LASRNKSSREELLCYEYTDEPDSNGEGHLEPCRECADLQDEIKRAEARLRDSLSQTIDVENAAQRELAMAIEMENAAKRELAMAEESQLQHNRRFH
jgi:hypothetical protein